jgi:2-iminoacetate synthase ThiH
MNETQTPTGLAFEQAIDKVQTKQRLNKEDWKALVSVKPIYAVETIAQRTRCTHQEALALWTSLLSKLYPKPTSI